MLDRLSREYYIIEIRRAKGLDSVTPFAKGVEIMPDGSVVRSGTNYSGKFQEAHDASKASIQSRTSNLESGGVKGTGNPVHRSEIDEVIKNNYDKDGNLINRSIVPKGYDSVEDFLKQVDDTTIKEFGDDSVEEFKEVVELTETYLNTKTKNNILNKPLAGGTHVQKGVDFDILGFPIFKGDDVKFSLKLEKDFYVMKDTDQFRECTKLVKEAIEKGEISKELFTKKQLAQINDGLPRIDGLIWHHHQIPGKMQLVIKEVHSVNHLGGNRLWGGGIR
ncbi:HNH endonuclease [Bacillus wiedmannii]|nr:HNH endonuclease [Bacillus wiedmannii]MCC2380290.1 HNH endonuclease [Bacillus wiedmannii]MCC2424286.1 HNH endonuclease [Bacillus wiedmannii]